MIQHSCPTCENLRTQVADLKAEIIELKQEVGAAANEWIVAMIIERLRASPQIARLISILYTARGKPVQSWILHDAISQATAEQLVTVCIYKARLILGHEAIVRGKGCYRMDEASVVKIDQMLAGARAIVAA